MAYCLYDITSSSFTFSTNHSSTFTNPASGSVGQDMIITNVLLFPLWTMIDGPRRGLRHTWIYFVMSLFTSFSFAMGLYLAAQERQVRWLAAGGPNSRP